MSKLSAIVAGVVAMPVLTFAGSALAAEAPTGQIEGGNIYRVKNLKGGDFVDPASATCGDTVQFRVRIHNIGANSLENVKVKATLPTAAATSHSSTVTISASNGNTVTDTAGVNLDKSGTLSYVSGSTELLDANQAKLATLNDGIVGGGVNLPDAIGVSTQQKRSVQFSAKVNCDTPKDKDIKVCDLTTKEIVTIKESAFDSSKHTKDLSKCEEVPVTPEQPTELVKTGAGDVAGLIAVVAVATAAGYSWFLRRQNAN